MAQLDFPGSPTNGQIFTPVAGGPSWQWDGSKWIAATTGSTAYAPILDPIFQGNPQAPQPAAGDADASIATTKFVSDAVATSLHDVGRNYLHNSMMNIAQRGQGNFTTAGVYTLDRWMLAFSGGTNTVFQAAMNDTDRAQIGDEAAQYWMRNIMTGGAGASDYSILLQRIENIRRLAGKTVTVSFWAISNTPKNIGVSFDRSYGGGGTPSPYETGVGQKITTTSTAARYSLTFAIPSISGKTVGTNGDSYSALNIWFSAGASLATASGGVGVQSDTFYIWGVQLEIGPTATPLEKLDPVTQLQQCQRFYCTGQVRFAGYQGPVAVFYLQTYPTPMRTGPQVAGAYTTQTNCTGSIAAWGAQEISISATVTTLGSFVLVGTYTASADL